MTFILPLLAETGHAVAEAGTLETIQKTFGWNAPFFIAQLINFIIVIVVLKKFAFGPIQKILEERRARIANGEEKLKLIERQLADSVQTTAAAISKANDEAKQGAATFTEQKAQEAISSAQQILARAEAAAKAEHERLTAELKREFGRLVIATTSQVTGKVLTGDDQRRINEDALATVEA
jgi:F-type H+-transporting ATPase subunit b